MSEKNQGKLRLNKETIRNLSDENLSQVAGGQGDISLGVCISNAQGACQITHAPKSCIFCV
jgi:hypothetical protein